MDRPAYEITFTNVTRGWSYTTTQGDEPDPDADVYLTDSFNLDWAFKNNEVPGQLSPDTGSFQLFVRSYDALPYAEQGDIVVIDLVRPTTGDPIVYMSIDGRISDANLNQTPKSGVLLDLIVVGPDSEFDFTYDVRTLETWPVFQPVENNVAYAFREEPAPNFVVEDGLIHWPQLVYLPFTGKVGEQTALMLAGALDLGTDSDAPGAPVLRTTRTWSPNPADWISLWPWRPAAAFCYLQRWRPAIEEPITTPLFEIGFAADDPDKVTVVYDPTSPTLHDDVLVIDAKHVESPQDWGKDRSLSPNRIEITGAANPDGTNTFERVYSDGASVAAKGVTTRAVNSTVSESGSERVARDTLRLSADPQKWATEALTIRTDTMDDATLDHYAPMFYPHTQPNPGKIGRTLALVNIDPDTDPTDGFYTATIVGTRFSVSGGVLTITPAVRPIALLVDAGMSASPDYDSWQSSIYADARYVDQGGSTDYIDPDLSYDQLKFSL